MRKVPDEFNLYAVPVYETVDTLLSHWLDERLDDRVKRIVRHLAVEMSHEGYEAVITSIWRTRTTDSGIHQAWRAVDLRETTPRPLSEKLRAWVNATFPYDPARPNMQTIVKLDHGTGPHFHVQVRP